jgi:putative nucleotidyltransferase with HDIG domain
MEASAMSIYKFISLFIAIMVPLLIFIGLKLGMMTDPFFNMPKGHFYIVSAVAFLSLAIAVTIGIAGKRLRNIKVSFISLSYISLAQMFLIHGLSTPNFILHATHLPSIAAQLSMFLATFWLWLSSLPSDNKLVFFLSRHNNLLVPVWFFTLAIFCTIGMIFPEMVDIIPVHAKPLVYIFTVLNILLNGITMYQYFQSYRYSQFPLQIAIVYSAGWLIVSQLIMVSGQMWKLSWWIYHFLLLASMIVMLIGLYKQYSVKGSLVGSLRALFTTDPFERIRAAIPPSIKALVIATEKKDTYTAGHTFRVTMYGLKLAEALQLKPEQLRAIVQGSLLHDVGKISISDTILNKPSKLNLQEREMIELHPINGYEMCKNLGFMREELNIIRSHHEKWDGSGYPDHLNGEEIPLLARIVAVVDVYDALTSERSYRKPWPHDRAMNLLIEEKGRHFDPVCVDAWVNLCEQDSTVYQFPSEKITEKTTGSILTYL